MYGLILQEFYSLRKMLKLYLIMIVVYSGLGLYSGDASGIVAYMILFATMSVIASFSSNEKNRWEMYANIVPVTRNQIVASYYIVSFAMVLVAFLLGIILCAVDSFIHSEDLSEAFQVIYGVTLIGVVYLSAAIPIIIRLGSERGRFILMALIALPSMAAMIYFKMGGAVPDPELIKMLLYISPVVAVLSVVISVFVAVGIYRKKEF